MEWIYLVPIAMLILIAVFLYNGRRRKSQHMVPENLNTLLEQNVSYYKRLTPAEREIFLQRTKGFLSEVRITGIGVEVMPSDRAMIAASAIIPIFGFPNWEYNNLKEVLVYPDSFSEADFRTTGAGRNIAGMVGWGSLQGSMLISQKELRDGFLRPGHEQHTGIHEFVHLVDKSDGATDGIPEEFLDKGHIAPWLTLIHDEMQAIRKGNSGIDPYAYTNRAEFFAVVSEYFFLKPEKLEKEHPELYKMLSEIFRQRNNE